MNYIVRFAPFVLGALTLTGIAGGCGGTTGQPAQPKPTVLNFAIASAEYSLALDRIVIVSSAARSPSPPMAAEIHLLDGHTLDDEVIPLGLPPQQAPTRISVTPDGNHAVVGIIDDASPGATGPATGAVVYVDLAARRVVGTYSMPSAVFEVAANDTTAFALLSATPATNWDATVYAVDLATGATAALSSSFDTSVAEHTRAAMSPDGKTLYLDCVAPSSPYQSAGGAMLESFTVSGAQLTPAATPSVACYEKGLLLYVSRDGSRVYTPAGVYSTALSKTHDATLDTVAVADPSNGEPVAAIALTATSAFSLDLLDPSTFAQRAETALPSLAEGGLNVPPNALNVFYDAAGRSRFVLVQWSVVQGEPVAGIVSM